MTLPRGMENRQDGTYKANERGEGYYCRLCGQSMPDYPYRHVAECPATHRGEHR